MARFVVIVGGGIAAYKALELIRELKSRGHEVVPVLTKAGGAFITDLSLSALSGNTCHTDLFSADDEASMRHIRLSREADALVVVPATADLIAKLATGLANDLASTLLLAADKPVLMAPSMNHKMWHHPATQGNIQRLNAYGVHVVEPEKGLMACGESGIGRLATMETLIERCEALVNEASGALSGKRIVMTAGPTREPIDGVRYLSNYSSGKQGYALAKAAVSAGAEVCLVSGPVSLSAPMGVRLVQVETAVEMQAAVLENLPADIAICVAAVADWRPDVKSACKLKKTGDRPPDLSLTLNPDILKCLCEHALRPKLVVGFAAETHDHLNYAKAKRQAKGCDWLVMNDVSAQSDTFGGEHNQVSLIDDSGVEVWPRMSKEAIARQLVSRISTCFDRG